MLSQTSPVGGAPLFGADSDALSPERERAQQLENELTAVKAERAISLRLQAELEAELEASEERWAMERRLLATSLVESQVECDQRTKQLVALQAQLSAEASHHLPTPHCPGAASAARLPRRGTCGAAARGGPWPPTRSGVVRGHG